MFQKAHVKKKKQQNKLVFSYSKISSFPGICLFKLNFYWTFMVVQSLSGVRLCNCMDCNTRGFPVFQYLPEFAQTHVHWVCDAIQPSHPLLPFSSCPQSFPASGSLLMSQLFTSGGQSISTSDSAPVLPMNIQDWFSLGLTGLISLQSKGLSRVFSNTTVQKHQFFSTQPSLWSNSHICTWLLEKL